MGDLPPGLGAQTWPFLTFVPGNRDGVPLHFRWLRILCIGFIRVGFSIILNNMCVFMIMPFFKLTNEKMKVK